MLEQHTTAYFIGIFIIVASHAYMLYKPNQPLMTMEQHCYLNIAGAFLIAYFFLWSQKYISF